MTKDEALKLALEALEEAADAIDSWGSYASGYFQVKHDLENDISKAKSAITAIKEALAQQEETNEPSCKECQIAYCSAKGKDLDICSNYVQPIDKRQHALDKMAENARELGLDY